MPVNRWGIGATSVTLSGLSVPRYNSTGEEIKTINSAFDPFSFLVLSGGRAHLLSAGVRGRFLFAKLLLDNDVEIDVPPAIDFYAQLSAGWPLKRNLKTFRILPLAIEGGYRYQPRDFTLETFERTYNFTTFYFSITWHFTGFSAGKIATASKKIRLPNPTLAMSSFLESSDDPFIEGDSRNLSVEISNTGPGLAEDVRLELTSPHGVQYGLSFPAARSIGDIAPGENQRHVIPITTGKSLSAAQEIKIDVACIEKDGFRADDSVAFTLLPEMASEKFPPILDVKARFQEQDGNGLLDAKETALIEIDIENGGRGNAWNLVPDIVLTGGVAAEHVAVGNVRPVNRLEPGQKTIMPVPLSADWDLPNGKVTVEISLKEGNGFDPAPLKISFDTQEFLEPELVVADIGIDDSKSERTFGDGDNIIENMETVEVKVAVQNRGQGRAKGVTATIISTDPNVNYDGDPVFAVGDLESGEVGVLTFHILVNNRYEGGARLPVFIEIAEQYQRFGLSRRPLDVEMNKVVLEAQEIDILGERHKGARIMEATPFTVDVDENIPLGKDKNPDALAVVIGNRDYNHVDLPTVLYAKRDAGVMKEYLERVFGVPEERILHYENATLGTFNSLFGQKNTPSGLIRTQIKSDLSDVYIFYSGHGAPDQESNEVYLVPSDANPATVANTCYSLAVLYENLSHLNARSVTVIIDACFSGQSAGGTIVKRGSPVSIEYDINTLKMGGKIVAFTSAASGQVASWYDDKKHGLFTYFFLKGIGGDADRDSNKIITVGELQSYLQARVSSTALYKENRKQDPIVQAADLEKILVKY